MNVRGERHKAVITVGKPGIFEAMDAATGKFLFAVDPGAQNVAIAIDPVTGVKTLLPEPPPPGVTRCPTANGRQKFPGRLVQPAQPTGITCRSYDHCMGRRATRRPASSRWT